MDKEFYTIKELHESPLFPYRETSIRYFINKEKSLKAERLSRQKVIIRRQDILDFLAKKMSK